MKRLGLLVVCIALVVTTAMADPKHKARGRRGYYNNGYWASGTEGLPPGLAKRGGDLPPGLRRHIERRGQLPPGLQKRMGPGVFGPYNYPGIFVDRDRDGFDDRAEHREFHRRLRDERRAYQNQYRGYGYLYPQRAYPQGRYYRR